MTYEFVDELVRTARFSRTGGVLATISSVS